MTLIDLRALVETECKESRPAFAVISSRCDAAVWRCVDRCFAGGDPRQAVAELELELAYERADYYLGHDWLLDVLRETETRPRS